jgi:C4-type Zn-finger protein|tara:strand:+ start:343 stop:567 length:225 start_codon:yes stop_codon:yes gene_type:complete
MKEKISVGSWITIVLVTGNILFTAGIISRDVETAQETANTAQKLAVENDKKVAVLVAKMEQGFINIEKLLKNGK